MGFTCVHIHSTKDQDAMKDEIRNLYDWEDDDKIIRPLKLSKVGSVIYVAVEVTSKKDKTRDVIASVVKTSIDNSDYFNFCYKTMSEDVAPYFYDCPISILKTLTETDSEWANEWRKKCYENHEAKKANKDKFANVVEGTVVKFKTPLDFSNGDKIDTFVLIDKRKNVFGAHRRRYKISQWKKYDFEILTEVQG